MLGVSALYHCPRWTARIRTLLRRVDHSTIFLFIAGTYTALAAPLPPSRHAMLLSLAWSAAAIGVARALFWTRAPRAILVGLYLVIGWMIVLFLGDLARAIDPVPLVLVVLGGLLYTAGAIVYARRRPDPIPHVFGFHEVFHALVVAAVALHSVAVIQIIGALR
jgi:hemolysin III